MFFLYDVLFFIFSLFYLPIFLLKGKHRHGLGQRFGIVPREDQEKLKNKKVFWLHAVSVGEAAIAVRFANALKTADISSIQKRLLYS